MHTLRSLLLIAMLFIANPLQANAFNIGNFLSGHMLLAQNAAANEDQAAKRIREQTGGRVLNVETAKKGGRVVYLVKVLLPSGTVRVVEVPGQ